MDIHWRMETDKDLNNVGKNKVKTNGNILHPFL